ncbi:MAG: hypothetical protein GOV01_02800 [Candidatus Altiarchaeota archaeon]|nr:hypothetical protein [Candidatus Altiarchaeota archaeon]
MKIPKYDFFEKVITAVMLIITLLGFYYAKTIYLMTQALIYDPTIIVGVLLFIILEVVLLIAVLIYSALKEGSK